MLPGDPLFGAALYVSRLASYRVKDMLVAVCIGSPDPLQYAPGLVDLTYRIMHRLKFRSQVTHCIVLYVPCVVDDRLRIGAG